MNISVPTWTLWWCQRYLNHFSQFKGNFYWYKTSFDQIFIIERVIIDPVCSSSSSVNSFTDVCFIIVLYGKNAVWPIVEFLFAILGNIGSKAEGSHCIQTHETFIFFVLKQSHESLAGPVNQSAAGFPTCQPTPLRLLFCLDSEPPRGRNNILITISWPLRFILRSSGWPTVINDHM